MSVLKMQAVGYLGQDCTSNVVNGKTVINGSLAYSEKWKDAQGNLKEKTTWIGINWWTDRTSVLQYLKKGTLCFIEGQPEARNYQSKTGEYVAQLSCRVFELKLLGGKKEDNTSQSAAPQNNNANFAGSDISEPQSDLPF